MAGGRTSRQRQSGYAIAAVSFIGMIAMAGAATMMSTAPVAEVAEIERSLLQVRAHWASVGMLTYTISRGRQDGACNGTCTSGDSTRATSYRNYFTEIYNAKNNKLERKNPNQRRWSYTELSDGYFIDTVSTVDDLDSGLLDGKLVMETIIVQVGPTLGDKHADTGSANTRTEFCTGLGVAGDACPETVANSNNSGVVRVQDFRAIRP